MVNWAHRGSAYTTEQAVEDFAVGFIGDLARRLGRADIEVRCGGGGEGVVSYGYRCRPDNRSYGVQYPHHL